MDTILETARGYDRLITFVTLAEAAGLKDLLDGNEPYTVFAPSDDAFDCLPAETIRELAKDRKRLADVIKWHIVPGKVRSRDIRTKLSRPNVRTVQGSEIDLTVDPGTMTIFANTAKVVQADIECTNGLIHIINAVLIPRVMESFIR
jgi:uncharacterized surface protein with fasciclin (FAS1) repeats